MLRLNSCPLLPLSDCPSFCMHQWCSTWNWSPEDPGPSDICVAGSHHFYFEFGGWTVFASSSHTLTWEFFLLCTFLPSSVWTHRKTGIKSEGELVSESWSEKTRNRVFFLASYFESRGVEKKEAWETLETRQKAVAKTTNLKRTRWGGSFAIVVDWRNLKLWKLADIKVSHSDASSTPR